ncbi:MAG: PorT family protein [Flavobacteriales bacterium]|nr:PorT family protein [Flavobacteriales bacterium]
MIKKLYLIGAICLLTVSTVKAQSEDRRENVEFGVRAGVNISNAWDARDNEFRADPKVGFAGGFFLGIPLGKFLGVQPEVLFSQKGFKASGTILDQPYSLTRTTSYVDIPLQLQFKPIEFVTLLAGPQFSYLLKQKDTYTFGSNSSAQEQEFKNENIRKNILGFSVGADIIVQNFMLSGRAGWDMQTNHGDGTSSTPRYKNQWVQVTLGFAL